MRIKIAGLLGRWAALCSLAVGALILAGCQTSQTDSFADLPPVPPPSAGTSAALAPAAPAAAPTTVASTTPGPGTQALAPVGTAPGRSSNSPEMIKIGDVLTVTYIDVPGTPPAASVKVREDGTITLLQNLNFIAAGKTSGDLEREIRAAYVPKYFVNMTVTVFMQNAFYFVDGEVKAPNRYPYAGKTTVLKAIASAGDFTDFAQKKKVRLTRTDGTSLIINCIKALSDPTLDVEVYPNDKIHVPRRIL